MQSQEIREKFLDFFKRRGHKIMPSSSLVPEDETVLFTSAGMQQFSLYLSGEKDPIQDFGGRHFVSCQKCFRTKDIEEVGDEIHHTFFEMLGNWSIGEDKNGYFKEGAIKYALEFLDEISIEKNKLWITIFRGESNIPEDRESFQIWQKSGIPKERIRKFGMNDNFWGPVGDTGPCGPSSEIHYDKGEEFGCQEKNCGPNCKNCSRFVEIWNLVFMEYEGKKDGIYKKLPQRNVDTGIGFERLVAILQKKESDYEADLFLPIIQSLEKQLAIRHQEKKRIFRILADHIKGSAFLISEGILPSNLDRGYVLRRLLRRSIRYARLLRLKESWYVDPIKKTVEIYKNFYPQIKQNEEKIITVIQNEEEKFKKALDRGLKELEKTLQRKKRKEIISGKEVFLLFQTYGFPMELTEEIAREKGFKIDESDFEKEREKHQRISRIGAEKKFKGGLVDKSYKTTKLHTAAHLLLQALREALGGHVIQKGSNITAERLRFDFSHSEKLTEKQIKKVESLVNQKIKGNLPVNYEEMTLEEAKKQGAVGVFEERYGDKVKVYKIGDFSKEICGGPHVKNTSELGKFKIKKEESVGAGIRRIKAVLITTNFET